MNAEMDFEASLTVDAFLGGDLQVTQFKEGYRAGVDAVLLAAAAPVATDDVESILDAGAGAGTVGLCVARRCPLARVVLIEREPAFADLAHRNVARNGLEDRVRVTCGDITVSNDALATLGLLPDSFDHVLANPPFHIEGRGTAASDPRKSRAHAMPADGLDDWVRFAARMALPGGTATLIHKAAALGELLAGFHRRFGAVKVLPVHAFADKPAIRVVLQGIKGSRAPLQVLPPFVLHNDDNSFTPAAAAILRHGAALPLQAS